MYHWWLRNSISQVWSRWRHPLIFILINIFLNFTQLLPTTSLWINIWWNQWLITSSLSYITVCILVVWFVKHIWSFKIYVLNIIGGLLGLQSSLMIILFWSSWAACTYFLWVIGKELLHLVHLFLMFFIKMWRPTLRLWINNRFRLAQLQTIRLVWLIVGDIVVHIGRTINIIILYLLFKFINLHHIVLALGCVLVGSLLVHHWFLLFGAAVLDHDHDGLVMAGALSVLIEGVFLGHSVCWASVWNIDVFSFDISANITSSGRCMYASIRNMTNVCINSTVLIVSSLTISISMTIRSLNLSTFTRFDIDQWLLLPFFWLTSLLLFLLILLIFLIFQYF